MVQLGDAPDLVRERMPDEGIDTGIRCLVSILRLFEQAADADQIRHQFGDPNSTFKLDDIVRVARRLGLKARAIDNARSRLGDLPMPVIAELVDGSFVIVGGEREFRSWCRTLGMLVRKLSAATSSMPNGRGAWPCWRDVRGLSAQGRRSTSAGSFRRC